MKNFFVICEKKEDYGTDYYASLINIRKWSLFQVSISWNEYPSWPYLQIRSGSGDLFNVLFWAYKFGLDFAFMSRTWNWARYDDLKDV